MFDVSLPVYLAFVVKGDATTTFDVFNVILSLIRFVINNDLKHRLVITLAVLALCSALLRNMISAKVNRIYWMTPARRISEPKF